MWYNGKISYETLWRFSDTKNVEGDFMVSDDV